MTIVQFLDDTTQLVWWQKLSTTPFSTTLNNLKSCLDGGIEPWSGTVKSRMAQDQGYILDVEEM